MIALGLQLQLLKKAGTAHISGVCGLDGHRKAPMNGFMASRETGSLDPSRLLLNISGNQTTIMVPVKNTE